MRYQTSLNLAGLPGLEVAGGQSWGAVRLIPLIRQPPMNGLFLQSGLNPCAVPHPQNPQFHPVAYTPFGFIVKRGRRHALATATSLYPATAAGPSCGPGTAAEPLNKHDIAWRMLPMHSLLQGFMRSLQPGTNLAWQDLSRAALKRHSWAPPLGCLSQDLGFCEEALARFELHENQCGFALLIGDTPLSCFITARPEDYRALHQTLLEDVYGETLYFHGLLQVSTPLPGPNLPYADIKSMQDLEAAWAKARQQWLAEAFRADCFQERVIAQTIGQSQGFTLFRFVTGLDPLNEQHLGEVILDSAGQIAHLHCFRLNSQQVRKVGGLS